jgi:anti-sigma B factor antagonist
MTGLDVAPASAMRARVGERERMRSFAARRFPGQTWPERGPVRALGRGVHCVILSVVTELAVHIAAHDTVAGPYTIIELVGQADVSAQNMPEVFAAEAAKAPRLLVIDLSGLSFIDSSALGVIVRTHRALQSNGGKLALVNPSPAVARILELVDIAHTIPVYATVEEATAT